jgi:hypothetical protein
MLTYLGLGEAPVGPQVHLDHGDGPARGNRRTFSWPEQSGMICTWTISAVFVLSIGTERSSLTARGGRSM